MCVEHIYTYIHAHTSTYIQTQVLWSPTADVKCRAFCGPRGSCM